MESALTQPGFPPLHRKIGYARIPVLGTVTKTRNNEKTWEGPIMQTLFAGRATLALTAATLLHAGSALADEPRGAVLANTCFSCHGTDGHSAGAMPSIDGKSADYIADTLKRFRDGSKASTVMIRIAKGFTDEEIRMLAAYFSSRK